MVKKMNKTGFIKELENRLKCSENEAIIINDCIEENFLIGKKNKEKTINLLIDRLEISEEEANRIYEVSSSIISEALKNKLRHPFKSKD